MKKLYVVVCLLIYACLSACEKSDGIDSSKTGSLNIEIEETNDIACLPGKSIKIAYVVTGCAGNYNMEFICENGYYASMESVDKFSGYIKVVASTSGYDGKVIVLVGDNRNTVMKSLTFVKGTLIVSDAYEADADGEDLSISITTDMRYSVRIPDNSKEWLSLVETETRSVIRNDILTVRVGKSNGLYRSANIELINDSDEVLKSITIYQGNNQIQIPVAHPCDMMDEIIRSGALNCQQRFYDTFAELMQYTVITSSSNEVIHRYYIAPSYIENCWNNFSRWAVNADHMYELAVKENDVNYQAVAITLRSMYFEMQTAIFGYIPFSEANQLRGNVGKPKFDDPVDIYAQIIRDLEIANSLYNVNLNLSEPSKDKIYSGNTAKWQKFTNSLMLRILMRLSNRSAEMNTYWGESVAQKVKKILDNPTLYPLMSSWKDNACVYYSGESSFQNTWGGYTQSTIAGHRGSEYFIAQLHDHNDPRKWLWFTPYSPSVLWHGIKSGYSGDETQTAGYPVMNFDIFINYKLPVSFMNYDEVCFLKAEAYWRNDDEWVSVQDVASYWYDEGIRASCKFWRYIYCDYLGFTGRKNIDSTAYRNFTAIEPDGDLVPVINDAAIDSYIVREVPFDKSNGLECIIKQKFLANFRICLEGYNDYRRTGYPKLTIGTGTYNNGILPRRLVYPNRVKTTNSDNYNLVLSYLATKYKDGTDNMLTPVWWSIAGVEMEK